MWVKDLYREELLRGYLTRSSYLTIERSSRSLYSTLLPNLSRGLYLFGQPASILVKLVDRHYHTAFMIEVIHRFLSIFCRDKRNPGSLFKYLLPSSIDSNMKRESAFPYHTYNLYEGTHYTRVS